MSEQDLEQHWRDWGEDFGGRGEKGQGQEGEGQEKEVKEYGKEKKGKDTLNWLASPLARIYLEALGEVLLRELHS